MVYRSLTLRGTITLLAATAGFALAAFVGLALAKSTHATVKTAHNSQLSKTILVSSKGRTVYELSGESRHHFLCTSSACFMFWPPLTVKSAKTKLVKAKGIKGKLGLVHRDGFFQVTLSGRPLYYVSGDTANGQANGQGIVAFGGTWHVVTASSHTSSTGHQTTGSTTTSPGYY